MIQLVEVLMNNPNETENSFSKFISTKITCDSRVKFKAINTPTIFKISNIFLARIVIAYV